MAVGGHKFDPIFVANLVYTEQPSIDFPFIANTVLIIPDTLTDTIEFSLNGRDLGGVIKWDDEQLVLSGAEIGRIWFKTNNPSGTHLRVFAEA
jgi:hypothetical protein